MNPDLYFIKARGWDFVHPSLFYTCSICNTSFIEAIYFPCEGILGNLIIWCSPNWVLHVKCYSEGERWLTLGFSLHLFSHIKLNSNHSGYFILPFLRGEKTFILSKINWNTNDPHTLWLKLIEIFGQIICDGFLIDAGRCFGLVSGLITSMSLAEMKCILHW